jgi:hypothetical protein
MRLLYDLADETSLLKPKARAAVLAHARQTTSAALQRLGIGSDDYADLEVLFVAHQLRLASSRCISPARLLRAYEHQSFALRPSQRAAA